MWRLTGSSVPVNFGDDFMVSFYGLTRAYLSKINQQLPAGGLPQDLISAASHTVMTERTSGSCGKGWVSRN
jgi:hypothetical protein